MTTDPSPGYKALELYNKGANPDKATDVWAMGITILEVLVGARAWEEKEMIQLKPGVKVPELLTLRKRPGILKQLTIKGSKDLVVNCLQWESKDRITSIKVNALLRSILK